MELPVFVFDFLNDLKTNNDRDWFAEHKDQYTKAQEGALLFADDVLKGMYPVDNIETPSAKKCLHRIYRDTRFSKDKTPYKNNFSGSLKRATPALRGGYYFHLQPGHSFVAGGFWGPNSADLLHIRQHLAADATELRKVMRSKAFQSHFGELLGDGVKTAPRGFSIEHSNIDLLRKKQFIVRQDFTDKEVHSADFSVKVVEGFKAMRPFFNVMSDVLTTNLNGESVL